MGRRCRLDDLFVRCRGIAHADVVHNALFEQVHVLKDKTHAVHERVGVNVPYVRAAQGNAPAAYVEEAGDEVGYGGLAAAGRSHNRGNLPLGRGKGHASEGFNALFLVVGKGYVGKHHVSALNGLWLRGNRQLRLGQNRVHCLNAAVNLHNCAVGVHHLHQNTGRGLGEDKIEDHGSGKPGVVRGVCRKHPDKYGNRHNADKNVLDDGYRGGVSLFPTEGVGDDHGGVPLDCFMQAAEGIHGLPERLDHRYAPDVLHRGVVHLLKGFLVFVHQGFCARVAVKRGVLNKREHDAHNGCGAEAPVHGEQDDEHDDRRDHGRGEVGKLVRDEALYLFDVLIGDFPQPPAACQHVKPKRDAGQMRHKIDFQPIQGPECR